VMKMKVSRFCKEMHFSYCLPFNNRVMVFNVTFNNISAISWLSVLQVEETGVHRDNH